MTADDPRTGEYEYTYTPPPAESGCDCGSFVARFQNCAMFRKPAVAAETLTEDLLGAFEAHQYAIGFEGIASDGEFAWLRCTCGWYENYRLPEDNIRLAERRWEAHWASVFGRILADRLAAQRADLTARLADHLWKHTATQRCACGWNADPYVAGDPVEQYVTHVAEGLR